MKTWLSAWDHSNLKSPPGRWASNSRPVRPVRTPATQTALAPVPQASVMPHAAGTLYAFSMHQTVDIPDDVFDAQVAELERELTVLKAHLETACPL